MVGSQIISLIIIVFEIIGLTLLGAIFTGVFVAGVKIQGIKDTLITWAGGISIIIVVLIITGILTQWT